MINHAIERANDAAKRFASETAAERRALLYRCAEGLEDAHDPIVETAGRESHLSMKRLTGELSRTTGQLRMLGDFVADGRHLPGIFSASEDGGIEMTSIPVGPVAVFGASNFPLAFGVAGGDTASALAAGCPVVVKAHPAQPETSRLIGEIMTAALPTGYIGLIEGGNHTSIALVTHPLIRAVGFTGSLAGGRALMDAAAARPDPIPVYAEMGSLNPVFVLPGATQHADWAEQLARSVTGSSGQLCTKPGLIVVPDTKAGNALADDIAAKIAEASSTHDLLTPAMNDAHKHWLAAMSKRDDTTVVAARDGDGVSPFAVVVDAMAVTDDMLKEHFGPTTIITRVPPDAYNTVAARLDGSLTVTVIGTKDDYRAAALLLPQIARNAGRVIWNGVPTGVAVCDAMVHGGPWPATSAASTTSVGTAAIARFRRNIALQGLPAELASAVVNA